MTTARREANKSLRRSIPLMNFVGLGSAKPCQIFS